MVLVLLIEFNGVFLSGPLACWRLLWLGKMLGGCYTSNVVIAGIDDDNI
jgi:hypothetical protein